MDALKCFANRPQQAHYWEAMSSPQSKLWLKAPLFFIWIRLISTYLHIVPSLFTPKNSAELVYQAVVKSLLN